MMAKDLANPTAAVVDTGAVERRKASRKQLDADKGKTTWLMYPEDICIAGVDYPADPGDPFYDGRVLLPLDPGMIDDIDQNGVKQPITVVNDGEVPKVDDGRRRTLHARAANLRRVERGEPKLRVNVFLEKGDAKHVFLTARRSNAYRVDDDVMAKAENANRAITRFGSTVEEVAAAENVSPKTVKEWLAVLELSVDARQAIAGGQISPSGALTLLRDVPRKEQGKVLADAIAAGGGKVNVREAEAGAKNARKDRTPPLPAGGGAEASAPAEAAPTKGVLKKLVRAHEKGELKLFDGDAGQQDAFVKAIRFVLGDLNKSGVKGLTAGLRALGVVK